MIFVCKLFDLGRCSMESWKSKRKIRAVEGQATKWTQLRSGGICSIGWFELGRFRETVHAACDESRKQKATADGHGRTNAAKSHFSIIIDFIIRDSRILPFLKLFHATAICINLDLDFFG